MSREKTTEEIRGEFLTHVVSLVDYWDKVEPDKRKAMEGVVFSIMTALDGCNMDLPGFIVAPCTNEEDKDYYIEKGENYYPYNDDNNVKGDIGGFLHEEIGKYWRKK